MKTKSIEILMCKISTFPSSVDQKTLILRKDTIYQSHLSANKNISQRKEFVISRKRKDKGRRVVI